MSGVGVGPAPRRCIVVAIENLHGGGAERVAVNLVAHWPNVEADVLLLVCSADGPYRPLVPESVKVVEIGMPSNPRNTVAFLRRVRQLLRPYEVAGVVSHITGMNRMMLRAGCLQIIKAPIVVVEHGNFVQANDLVHMNWFRWLLLRAEVSFLYRQAAVVVGVSEGVTRQIGRLFRLPARKLASITNPVDVPISDPLPLESDIESKFASLPLPRLISVGRLTWQKGFSDLISAFALLPKGSLTILGEGADRSDLERRAADLGVANRVFMPGFVRNPAQFLRKADLFVSTSHWEGFPLVLLEAYASGVPIVARACDFGPEEIVSSDRPGRLVRSMRIEPLVEAISSTLADEPRFSPGTKVSLSSHDPKVVARRYASALAGDIEYLPKGERLRILMFISELGYGGAEGLFNRVLGYLSVHHDVRVVLFQRHYASDNYQVVAEALDVPVTVLDEGPASWLVRWWRRWRRLHVLKSDSDVAISFLSGPNLLNALTAGHVPVIVSEVGSKIRDKSRPVVARWFWTHILDRIAYWRADAITTVSAGLADEIRSGNRWAGSKLISIEGAVETDVLMAAAEAAVEPEFLSFSEYRTVVAFGRMHEHKGFDFLIQVFAEVRKRDSSARLLLIGDGPRSEEYKQLARNLSLRAGSALDPQTEDVTFAGYREHPAKYLRLARVFALPSRTEGLPNALIEALASGVPVVAADCAPGVRSILSGSPEELEAIPYELHNAVPLHHGVLMPQIEHRSAAGAWGSALAAALSGHIQRRPEDVCRAAVSRFDIARTGQQWLEVLHRVVDTPQR